MILTKYLGVSRHFNARMISFLVSTHGIFLVASTMIEQLVARHYHHHYSEFYVDVPLVVGLSLIYLGRLLGKRKRTAWLVAIGLYAVYMVVNITPFIKYFRNEHIGLLIITRVFILPVLVLTLLFIYRKEFVVRSDRQGFTSAVRFSVMVLAVAFVYGVSGFVLLDKSDFRQDISVVQGAHYTIDQFNVTTSKPLIPHTKRARIFDDSLTVVSVLAFVYAALSFFQPLRLKFTDQTANRHKALQILQRARARSEDYFKLWPHDKQYFFDESDKTVIAYHVWRGTAVCLGDPVGHRPHIPKILNEFEDFCYQNDWTPAYVHIIDRYEKLYLNRGYSLQPLGQEAVVDIANFLSTVAPAKYFRQIGNKFAREGYSVELLQPPHHPAVITRLGQISSEWLSRGGRSERGFAMGYFDADYLQSCNIMIARDAAGTIEAFLNQIPADFDKTEATYDMSRQSNTSAGNINDYLLVAFMKQLQIQGYSSLNLGLCPLAGLNDVSSETSTILNAALKFAFANGDKLYSFSGLYTFKAKYQPTWRYRYIAYQGGVRGFSVSMTALMRIMRRK